MHDDLDSGFRVGEWWVLPQEGSLRRHDGTRYLKPQPMALLTLLAHRGGEIVSKEEIFDSIWQGTAVEEGGLPRCISEIRSALGDDARDPRYIQTLRKRGYRLLLPVERGEQKPSDSQIAPAEDEARLEAASPRHPTRWLRLAAPGLLLIAALAITWQAARQLATGTEALATARVPPAASGQTRVAVLGVTSLSSQPATNWLAPALTEMLTTELAVHHRLRTVPVRVVEKMKEQLSISGAGNPDNAVLSRLVIGLGVDYAIQGTFLVSGTGGGGSDLRLDLKIYGDGPQIEAAVVETGTVDQLDDLVLLAGMRLRRELGAGKALANQPRLAGVPRPADPDAARLYFEGLTHLRRFESAAAIERLQRSITEDPTQPYAQLAMAQAWAGLGYDGRAAEAARTATELSDDLDSESRLWVEAEAMKVSGRWPEAIDRLRALRLIAPDNLEYGLELARAAVEAGRPSEALELLEELRDRASAGHRDPRIELGVAEATRRLSDHRRALAAATVAWELADELDARLVAAHALRLRAISLEALGQVTEADSALQEAAERFLAEGDRVFEAKCQIRLAAWLENRGDGARAEKLERSALAVFVETGNVYGEATALSRLAAHVWNGGDAAEAQRMFERSIDLLRQIGDRAGEAYALNSYAVSRAIHSAGGIVPLFEQVLAIHREVGDQDGINAALTNLGRAAVYDGRVKAAIAHLSEAAAIVRPLGLQEALAYALLNLGYARSLSGDVGGATAALAETVEIFRQTQNPRMLAESLEALAAARLAADDPDAARRFLEESLRLSEETGDGAQTASSKAMLSRALMAGEEVGAAEQAAREAVTMADESGNPLVRERARASLSEALLGAGKAQAALRLVPELDQLHESGKTPEANRARGRLTIARVLAACGELTRARELVEGVHAFATERGADGLRLEAELVGLGLEAHEGDRVAVRGRLQQLSRDASVHGMAWLARRAAHMADSPGNPG